MFKLFVLVIAVSSHSYSGSSAQYFDTRLTFDEMKECMIAGNQLEIVDYEAFPGKNIIAIPKCVQLKKGTFRSY